MIIDDQVTARDEVKRILNEARDAIREIEIGVGELNSRIVELLLLADIPDRDERDEVEQLANDVGVEVNTLFEELDRRFEMLRKEIAATIGGDDKHHNDDDSD
jgi:hypothetical protein